MGLILNVNGLLSGTPKVAGTYKFEVSVKDLDGNQASGMVSLIVNPAPQEGSDKPKSIYDGTYTGTFEYEYPSYHDGFWGEPMIPDSFTLSITLKTHSVRSDTIYLYVTNVVSSNPDFGTGPNGIAPTRQPTPENFSIGGVTGANLPAKPPSTYVAGIPEEIAIFSLTAPF